MRKAPTLEEARAVIEEFPEVDWYVDANYANGLGGHNEYWDNTIDTSEYWEVCKKLTELNPIIR